MKHVLTCAWLVLSFCGTVLQAQEPLANETILKLVKAGIGEETIVGMVNQQPGKYGVAETDITALKSAGVSEKIIAAMIVKGTNTGSTSSKPPATPNNDQSSDRIRVFITDSQSWQIMGGFGASGGTAAGHISGGARPQTAEIIKTFNQRCPEVTVTNNIQKAEFAVALDHEGGKGYARRRNKIVVFNHDGDAIFTDSTRALGNSVKDACQAIVQHVSAQLSSGATSPNPK